MKIKKLGVLLSCILAFSLILASTYQQVQVASAVTVLFAAGFETWSTSEFTGEEMFYGDAYYISDLAAFNGDFGWRCQSTLGYYGQQGRLYKDIEGTITKIYVQEMVRCANSTFTTMVGATTKILHAATENLTGGMSVGWYRYEDGTRYWLECANATGNGRATVNGSLAIVPTGWTRIEMVAELGSATGEVAMWVNGTQVISTTQNSTKYVSSRFERISFGTVYVQHWGDEVYTWDFDNCQYDTEYIGVGVRIVDGGVSHATTTVPQTETVWFNAVYEFDESEFTNSSGTLFVNGSAMTWSPDNNRWEHNYAFTSAGTRILKITSVVDANYGVATVNDTVGDLAITWKGFVISVDGIDYLILIDSNSTVSGLSLDQPLKKLAFNVTEGAGFCNITIPTQLLGEPYTLQMDGLNVTPMVTSNSTHQSLYFTYLDGANRAEISGTTVVPEFPILTSMILLLSILSLTLLVTKRKVKYPT